MLPETVLELAVKYLLYDWLIASSLLVEDCLIVISVSLIGELRGLDNWVIELVTLCNSIGGMDTTAGIARKALLVLDMAHSGVWSRSNSFLRHQPSRANGGKAYPLTLLQSWANASEDSAYGSGLQL